jgi:Ca2+-binding EF-hand superfamily protein
MSITRLMMKSSLTLVALFCSGTLVAFAEEAPAKISQEQVFKNFDANGDGAVSLSEYKTGMAGNMSPIRVEKVFKEKDRNNDGKLNIEELFYVPQDQRPAQPEKKETKGAHKGDKPATAR